MPQLAPVNWLFLFFIFWFIVVLSSTLIWWSSKTEYAIEGVSNNTNHESPALNSCLGPLMKSWNW